MKKLILCLLASIVFTLEVSAKTQDTLKLTVNNLKFTTIDDGIHKTQKVVTYQGKAYTYTGSAATYKKQLKYFGDCRILIVNNKIIIL